MKESLVRNSKFLVTIVCVAVSLFIIFPQTSDALVIFGDTAASTEHLGDFLGELIYSSASTTEATLIVELTNTSPADNGGYITAFVFNNPGDRITSVALDATDDDFNLLGEPDFKNRIRASPFGKFDIGASISHRFGGGKKPKKGIAVGVTETFTFDLTGDDLDILNEWSFVSELSKSKKHPEFFVVRFRGFEDCGSDKVPATAVPEPTALSLLGLGLVGFVVKFKKERR